MGKSKTQKKVQKSTSPLHTIKCLALSAHVYLTVCVFLRANLCKHLYLFSYVEIQAMYATSLEVTQTEAK